MSGPLTELKLDFNVDDTAESLSALLKRVEPAWQAAGPIKVDLSECEYLGPLAVVVLSALHERARIRGSTITIDPPRHDRLLAYCGFSGLLHRFLHLPAPDPSHPKNETLPLTSFQQMSPPLLNAVIGLVRRHMEMGRGAEEVLKTAMSEVMYNVADHAESPMGGLLSARAFHDRREVRVTMGDIGVGVLATLRRTIPDLSTHEDALREAIQANRSARTTGRNLGQGLTTIDEIVKRNSGDLLLVSHGAIYVRRARKVQVRGLPDPFPGTLVNIRFRVDNALYDDDIEDNDVW